MTPEQRKCRHNAFVFARGGSLLVCKDCGARWGCLKATGFGLDPDARKAGLGRMDKRVNPQALYERVKTIIRTTVAKAKK